MECLCVITGLSAEGKTHPSLILRLYQNSSSRHSTGLAPMLYAQYT